MQSLEEPILPGAEPKWVPKQVGGGAKKHPWEDVELGPLIGQGSFGKVYRGVWNGAPVAVKVCAAASLSSVLPWQFCHQLVHNLPVGLGSFFRDHLLFYSAYVQEMSFFSKRSERCRYCMNWLKSCQLQMKSLFAVG